MKYTNSIMAVCLAFTAFSLCAQPQQPDSTVLHLGEVVVNGSAQRNLNGLQVGSKTITSKDILQLPTFFGEADIVRSLQTQPGVSQGMEGFTGLFVHGGGDDQNLFLYEGLPIYNTSGHLAGVFSAFNVSTVSHVDFYKVSFPAQYGGRVSSIVDIRMKQPDFEKYTGRFSLGLLSANGYFSGPIINDKLAFSVGMRRSLIDVFGRPVLAIINKAKKKDGEKTIGDYHFTDFNARLDYKVNSLLTASLIGYYGRDYLKFGHRDFTAEDYGYVVDPATGEVKPADKDDATQFYDENTNRLKWGNWGVLGKAVRNWGSGMLNLSAYYSSYNSNYRQGREYQSDESKAETYGYNWQRTRNGIDDLGASLSLMQTFGSSDVLRAGIGYIHHSYLPEKINHDWFDDGNEQHKATGTEHVHANEAYAYLDNSYDFTPWLSVEAGVRATSFAISGKTFTSLELRASIKGKLNDNLSLKAAYSRMTQMAQQVSNNNITLPTDLWRPVTAQQKPVSSDQVAVGAYGNLPWHAYFSVEGWYKNMHHLLEYRDGVSVFNQNLAWTDKVVSGRGWAYGVDLTATKWAGPFTGTVSYALLWNWRKFPQLNGGEKFPSKYDNRHKINVNLSYKPKKNVEWNAAWTFMTGNRQTLSVYNYDQATELYPDAPGAVSPSGVIGVGLDVTSKRNNYRLPAFHRLDVSVTITRELKHGATGAWTFGLYNAYCHMNAMTVEKHEEVLYWTNDVPTYTKSFRTLSLLPIMPSVTYTYSF